MAEAMLQQKIVRMRQRRTAPLILELDLTEGLTEEPPSDPVSALLTMRRTRLADVLEGLRRARSDDRVKALVVKLGGRAIGLARVQELRAAVQEFARAGKTTVAWAETFGESSPGNVPYYLATAFDKIYLQPSGELDLTGISIQQLFFRDAMDKLGLDYQVAKRQEYKSAADRLTERGFTGPAREAMQRLAVSITQQLTGAIAGRLKIGDGEARALIDHGPFLATEALNDRLVDALGYRDQVYADVRKDAGPGAFLLYLGRYQRSRALAQRARKLPNPAENMIALIHATGPIRRGRSGRGPVCGPPPTTAGPGRSSCGSTAPAAPMWRPTRSGARWCGLARPARRWWCRWRTWPPPAGISSPWRPTRSWRSQARSPAPSGYSPASRSPPACCSAPG
jgi:protease-4